MKPNKTKKQEKPIEERVDDSMNRVIELEQEVELLAKDLLPRIKAAATAEAEKTKEMIISMAREHFNMREARILSTLFEFIKAAPIWETQFVPGSSKDREQVESLYRQGWRYMSSAFDENTKMAGTVYHRPKTPKTFEEFRSMYEGIVLARKAEEKKKAEKEAARQKIVKEMEEAEAKKKLAKPIQKKKT